MLAVAEVGVAIRRVGDETDLSVRPITIRRVGDDMDLAVRPITVRDYHRMVETGILTGEDRVELLEGLLVVKSPQSPGHAAAISRVLRALNARMDASEWYVRIQSPVTTSTSEPEPDVIVVPTPLERFDDRHPGGEEIALAVQVSSSSLKQDRRQRGGIMSAAGVPAYWIVNLVDGRVEVYTRSTPTGYGQCDVYERGALVPLEIGGERLKDVAVDELLPRLRPEGN